MSPVGKKKHSSTGPDGPTAIGTGIGASEGVEIQGVGAGKGGGERVASAKGDCVGVGYAEWKGRGGWIGGAGA